jgi:hypothetical protein
MNSLAGLLMSPKNKDHHPHQLMNLRNLPTKNVITNNIGSTSESKPNHRSKDLSKKSNCRNSLKDPSSITLREA